MCSKWPFIIFIKNKNYYVVRNAREHVLKTFISPFLSMNEWINEWMNQSRILEKTLHNPNYSISSILRILFLAVCHSMLICSMSRVSVAFLIQQIQIHMSTIFTIILPCRNAQSIIGFWELSISKVPLLQSTQICW